MQAEHLEENHDYYDVLNISKSATKAEIRESFVRLQNTFSRQSLALYGLFSEEETLRNLKLVEQAFRILNDDALRQEYDRKAGYHSDWAAPTGFKQRDWKDSDGADGKSVFSRSLDNDQSLWSSGYQGHSVHKEFSIPVSAGQVPTYASGCKDEALKLRYEEILCGLEEMDGGVLSKLREAGGVSLEEMAERPKISIQYLKSLESNAFENLPSLVFIKGFVKSYLRYLVAPHCDLIVSKYAELVAGKRQAVDK